MKITVEVFAALKDYFSNEFVIDSDKEISVKELLNAIHLKNPESKSVLDKCRVAIAEEFVTGEYIINHESRVCIIPPSSGG